MYYINFYIWNAIHNFVNNIIYYPITKNNAIISGNVKKDQKKIISQKHHRGNFEIYFSIKNNAIKSMKGLVKFFP